MDTLKHIKIFILLMLSSCVKIEYKKIDNSFNDIHLKEWNSLTCPKKIILERYKKNTSFKTLIDSNKDFDINGCDSIYYKFNQRVFAPKFSYTGPINYDMKIIIDDSLEYKITDIKDKLDTISGNSGPGKWIIMNNIKSLVVNGKKLDNTKKPLSFSIPTNLGKIIKK
ncbi:hypothetical protein [Flavobacterium notoginsengisoli]|uniref:hypothetical protein n=1 Tax=Flavobacterium notoginsengisoli TaxID=1478199 RepID=UPI00362B481E